MIQYILIKLYHIDCCFGKKYNTHIVTRAEVGNK